MTTRPTHITPPIRRLFTGHKTSSSQARRSIATGIITYLGFQGTERKRYGGRGTAMLGETIDQTINHEINLLKEILSHGARVY
jgi:hypothetical protein